MKSAFHTENNDTEAKSQISRTFGEVFADGSLIEVVASANGDLNLLLSNGKTIHIAPQVEHHGRVYQVQELPASIVQATRLPREPVSYGTILQLFNELRDTFEENLGLSRAAAQLISFWILSTWFCDCLLRPPAMWISGVDIEQAADLLELLHCVCRRALRLTGVTRAGFLSLPMAFHPALLVNQPSLSRSLQCLLCESNFRGSVIPGKGTVTDVTSSKAIFVGMARSAPLPSPGNLHVALFPSGHEVPHLDERVLNATAGYFLPRLLQYRLDHAHEVRESRFVAAELRSSTRELARKLAACIQGDADLALQVIPLVRSQDEMVNRCDLDHAIIEILWPRLHASVTQTPAKGMKIEAELTAQVNTFLLCCGETRQFSREEVGIRVASLELSRKHTNAGTLILLDRETSRRVHQLARGYGIDRVVPGCPDCQAVEPSVE